MTRRPRTTSVADEVAAVPSTPGPNEHPTTDGLVSRRVRVAALLAPVAFVTIGEFVRLQLERSPWWSPAPLHLWRVGLYLGFVGLIAGFALVMLRHIERREAQVMRQNRDLVAANSIAGHVRAAPGRAADVVAAAASAIATASAARHVRLRLYGDPATDHPPLEATAGPDADAATNTPPALDRPLRDTGHIVGRLEVWDAPGRDVRDWVGPRVEEALAHQVSSAVRLSRAFDDLYRRRDEGHVFYGVLLDISRQTATLPTLTALARHARDLLGADAGAVVVDGAVAAGIRFDSGDAPGLCPDGSALLGVGLPVDESGDPTNPVGDGTWAAEATREVSGPTGPLGVLWVGRRTGEPFTERDRSFLATMAGLAGIAVTSARVLEESRQHEVLSERTRIAREMHDSLAQVLGAMHLRLRMLATEPEVAGNPDLVHEASTLADLCDEGYRDVREAILGLRDAHTRAQQGLHETLDAYAARYAAQSGVPTTFVNEVGPDLALSPRTEVHLIRVVQEALTNVRKHAGASRATVTVTGTADSTTITVADDGRGFTLPAPGADSYGLSTMRDRLALLQGTLDIRSAPRRGTLVVATVPEPPTGAGGVRGDA